MNLAEAFRSFRESVVDLQTALEPESYASMNNRERGLRQGPTVLETRGQGGEMPLPIPVHPMTTFRLHDEDLADKTEDSVMKKNGASSITKGFFNIFVLLLLVQLGLK